MDNIYKYEDEFDKSTVIKELTNIEEEMIDLLNDQEKSAEDRKKEEFKLIYQQFIKGLKLSII